MAEIAYRLELALGCVIWDETGLSGHYDVEIPIRSLEEAQGFLARAYGLKLEPVQKPTEILVIYAVDNAGH